MLLKNTCSLWRIVLFITLDSSTFHSHSRNRDLLTCYINVRPISFLYRDMEETVDLHIEERLANPTAQKRKMPL